MFQDALKIDSWQLLCVGALAALFFLFLGWFLRRSVVRLSLKEEIWAQCDRSGEVLDASHSFWQFFSVSNLASSAGFPKESIYVFRLLRGFLQEEDLERLQKSIEELGEGHYHYVVRSPNVSFCMAIQCFGVKQPLFLKILPATDLFWPEEVSGKLSVTISHEVLKQSKLAGCYLRKDNVVLHQNTVWLGTYGREMPDFMEDAQFKGGVQCARRSGLLQHILLKNALESTAHDTMILLWPDDAGVWLLVWRVPAVSYLQAQLALQSKQMSALCGSLPFGSAIFDENGCLSSWNTLFVNVLKLDAQWVANHPNIEEFLEALRAQRLLSETIDFQGYLSQVRALLKAENCQPYEELIHLPDDRIVRFILIAYPMGGLLLLCQDLTDKVRAAHVRHESQALLKSLGKHSDAGIVILSEDMRVRFVNQKALALWNLREKESQCLDKRFDVLLKRVREALYIPYWEKIYVELAKEWVSGRGVRSGLLLLANGGCIKCQYTPLITGEHFFHFSDITHTFRLLEASQEAERLLFVERLLLQAHLKRLRQRMYLANPTQQNSKEESKATAAKDLIDGGKQNMKALLRHYDTLEGILTDTSAVTRDVFLCREVLEEVLSLFDGFMNKKNVHLVLRHFSSLQLIMNRQRCEHLLALTLGYILKEAAPGATIRVSPQINCQGASLRFSTAVRKESLEDALSGKDAAIRFWIWSTQMLNQYAYKAGCKLSVHTQRKNHLILSVDFPASAVQERAPEVDNGPGNLLRFAMRA